MRNADHTQQRLIETAAAIIALQGVAGLRVDEVAKQARINKRMIYHYFGSKNGLWLRVLDQSVVDLCASVPKLSDAAKAFLRAELLMNSSAPKSINESPITAPRLQRAAQIILRRFLDGPVVSSELQDHDWRVLYLLLCRLAFSRTNHEADLDVSKRLLTAQSGEPSALLSTKPRYQLRPSFRTE